MFKPVNSLLSLFFFFLLVSSPHVIFAAARQLKDKENPFTPKAYLNRYWNQHINQNSPKSLFLLSKASPLNAVDTASFAKLADQNTLSKVLPSFCSSANLFCFPDSSPSLAKHKSDPNFADYSNKTFTNYGTGKIGGANSFKNYSRSLNTDGNDKLPFESFNQYSRNSGGRNDKFSGYGSGTSLDDLSNDIHERFNSYGSNASGGAGEFKNYVNFIDIPDLKFKSYSEDSGDRPQSFSSYAQEVNAGNLSFTSYGKNGNGDPNEFVSYSNSTRAVDTTFKAYGQTAIGVNDTFIAYGFDGSEPKNKFKSYGDGGNAGVDTFINYLDKDSAAGDNSFQSYAKNSKSAKVSFANYEPAPLITNHRFTEYGQKADGQKIGFKVYGPHYDFKGYAKKGVTFASYKKSSTDMKHTGGGVNKWVEPGKFFRESMLTEETLMPMPDIRDKMPQRSFLPRSIVSKLPFSSSKMSAMKETFHASDNSTMERIMKDALNDCERAPSQGETKRCVGSAEDMIDFATSVLGRYVALRTTENVKGSKQDIMIGSVKGINGGKVTKSVSCHQSLFPYLLYYCHSVPKVRVYEADILDPKTKAEINHGVAICHLDTSAWSPTHGAFVALASGPGHIEVCHWIFENDLTWTIAD